MIIYLYSSIRNSIFSYVDTKSLIYIFSMKLIKCYMYYTQLKKYVHKEKLVFFFCQILLVYHMFY